MLLQVENQGNLKEVNLVEMLNKQKPRLKKVQSVLDKLIKEMSFKTYDPKEDVTNTYIAHTVELQLKGLNIQDKCYRTVIELLNNLHLNTYSFVLYRIHETQSKAIELLTRYIMTNLQD